MVVNKIKVSSYILLAVLAHAVCAAPVYITDKLNVGLHEEKTLDSPIVAVLPSGTELELVKREDNFSFVSDKKGTTGWVDNSYLLDEAPAGEQVKTLTARNASLVQQLKSLQAGNGNSPANSEQLAKLQKENDSLQQQYNSERLKTGELQVTIAELRKRLGQNNDTDALYQEIDTLKETNKDLEVKLANALDNRTVAADAAGPIAEPVTAANDNSIKFSWKNLAIITSVLFVIGLAAGVYLMDFLNRRRHGGFRI